MAELMERLDKIMAGKASFTVVASYLLALWPVRSVELIPVSALLAVLLSLGQLSRRMEITAAMSGGIHPWRFTSPLLYSGLALSLFSFGLSEAVTPWANRQVKKLWNTEIRHLTSRRPTRFDNVTVAGDGFFIGMGLLDLEKGRIENMVVDAVQDGQPTTQWQARWALWTPEGWRLFQGVERRFERGMELSTQKAFKEKQTDRRISPEDLMPRDPDPEEMNRREIKQNIARFRILGNPIRKMQVEFHMKSALPWANFIIILLGIPFAFNKRGGKVRAVAVALAVAFSYFGLIQVGRALGQKIWCPPFLGAWLANIVFLAVGARLFWRMRSLS
jgi:lipopolysaccharide export system permease protein